MKKQQIIFRNKPPSARKPTGKPKNTLPIPRLFRKLCKHAHKASGTRSQSFGNTTAKPMETTLYETNS